MTISRMIAPALAFAALATAQTAQAQQPACVAAADLSDAASYAMPIAFDAAQSACTNRWSRDGFAAQRGEAFIAQFRASQDKTWPGALRLIKVFMADGAEEAEGSDAEMKAIITSLPDEALRPFVDGLVGQLIADEIKGDSCNQIERGLELISPLPTENVGGLVAFVAQLADLKNPPICGGAPAVMKK